MCIASRMPVLGAIMPLDPQQTYVSLSDDGAMTRLPGGEEFWKLPEGEMAQAGTGWLVSEYLFEQDWLTWEMHPDADEFVYLLSGDATLYLERAEGVHSVTLSGNVAVIVPRGVWHTAKVAAPSRMLHITRGAGTQTRPV
jgi:mannose-6-phosphate isomerase-like protein (cupin superfamily)